MEIYRLRILGLPVTFWFVFTDTDMVNYIRGVKFDPFSSSFKWLTKPHLLEPNLIMVKIPVGSANLNWNPSRMAREVDVDTLADNLRKISSFGAVYTNFKRF